MIVIAIKNMHRPEWAEEDDWVVAVFNFVVTVDGAVVCELKHNILCRNEDGTYEVGSCVDWEPEYKTKILASAVEVFKERVE